MPNKDKKYPTYILYEVEYITNERQRLFNPIKSTDSNLLLPNLFILLGQNKTVMIIEEMEDMNTSVTIRNEFDERKRLTELFKSLFQKLKFE